MKKHTSKSRPQPAKHPRDTGTSTKMVGTASVSSKAKMRRQPVYGLNREPRQWHDSRAIPELARPFGHRLSRRQAKK